MNFQTPKYLVSPQDVYITLVFLSLLVVTYQSSLAKQELHSSFAGSSPRGRADLVEHFSHGGVVPGRESIVASSLLDQLQHCVLEKQ